MRSVRAGHPSWVVRQGGWILLGVVLYFGARGLTAGEPHIAVANAHEVLSLERYLGLDIEGAAQASLFQGRDWLIDAANWVYIWGHWPVIGVVLLWLGLRHRRIYLRLRNAMFVSGTLGLLVFAWYPVAPPRLAGLGLIDTVTERSQAYRVLQPPAFVNQYAAMPSLHVGWDLLIGLAVLAAATAPLLRLLAVLMPILMAIAVVVTGNHYVLDVPAGALLALSGYAAALWLERREPVPAAPPRSLHLPRHRVRSH